MNCEPLRELPRPQVTPKLLFMISKSPGSADVFYDMMNLIAPLFNPAAFQGRGKKHTYFEGWYFKVVNAPETKAFAFIPGIAMDGAGNRQAFIQVLDGKRRLSRYHKFDMSAFVPSSGVFDIAIGENRFSTDAVRLHLPGIEGGLRFHNVVPWPSHWYSPGIMGPYTFVPFMECYHAIVSMDHSISGRLEVEGEPVDFDNGRGYIEKDWGCSFPKAYVWMQSNHFGVPGISLKASIAKVPWIGSSFVGFIAGLWFHDRLIRFTTYNGSSLRKLAVDAAKIDLVLENKDYHLDIKASRDEATSLASPIRGMMDGRIEESMSSGVEVTLTEKKTGMEVFRDSGRNAAVEVAGKIDELVLACPV
jgi:tocopherol cyclase